MSAPSQSLCPVCRFKPRHASFQFCGKKCASKATTLCNYCFLKDKFPPYEYCGKKCAASAAKVTPAAANGTYPQAQATPGPLIPHPAPTTKAPTYAKNLPPRPYAAQAQGLPAASQPPPLPLPQAPLALKIPNVNVPLAPTTTAKSVLQSVKQVFSSSSEPAQPQQQNSKPQYGNQLPAASSLDCLIPGCGKAVHVDENGVPASDYCSQRHREQAVNSGMVSPCIMCLSLPQGDVDHFCSRLCREEALSRPL